MPSPNAEDSVGADSEITVLVVGLTVDTVVSESFSAEQAVALLNRWLTLTTAIAVRHGGTVDQIDHNGFSAFFGREAAQTDHPARAVRASVEIRERMAGLDGTRLPEIKFAKIGINTGRAVVGLIGPTGRMDYKAIGDTVTLAHRIQGLAKEYAAAILITGDTKNVVDNLSETRYVDSIPVRGRSQSTDIYEVIDLKAELK